jgi:hypothetical protein
MTLSGGKPAGVATAFQALIFKRFLSFSFRPTVE